LSLWRCQATLRLAELVRDGATASAGVDISGNFRTAQPPGLELIRGDLSDLESVPGLAGRTFDRILFLQSFGRRYPHKRAWMDKYLGILIFKLRPLPS
jgi:hypothetical protein